MRILYCYTLNTEEQVNQCIRNINISHIPLRYCRFFYTNDTVKSILENRINKEQVIQSCGLAPELDHTLNVMRISKNKPDFTVIGLTHNSRITRFKDFEIEIQQFQNSLANRLCLFSTSFTNPCKQHIENRLDTRIIICNGIHKDMLDNYIDTCEQLDSEYLSELYTQDDVLMNMNMTDSISINFTGLKNQLLFQMFYLQYLTDYDNSNREK